MVGDVLKNKLSLQKQNIIIINMQLSLDRTVALAINKVECSRLNFCMANSLKPKSFLFPML